MLFKAREGKRKRSALDDAIISRLRASGYLFDTPFEGKETHSLTIHPLTKKQALDAYRKSGGETWIWDELEKNMPYAMPKAETMDVMIMNFGKNIRSKNPLSVSGPNIPWSAVRSLRS